MAQQSGKILNRSGFIQAVVKGTWASVGYGNIFEGKLRAWAGSGQMVLGPGRILKFWPVEISGINTP
jgi:hypothetical protein